MIIVKGAIVKKPLIDAIALNILCGALEGPGIVNAGLTIGIILAVILSVI